MDEHDLTTFDCKTPLCDRPAAKNRGPYAYLCDHCRKHSAKVSTRGSVQRSQSLDGSFEARARSASKRLIAAGRKVDGSRAKASDAVVALKQARGEWDAVVDELSRPVQAEA